MQEREKPDAVVRVNDFDVTLYRRGRGLEIRVEKSGFEVGFFGLSGIPLSTQQIETPAVIPSPSEQIEVTTSPSLTAPVTAENKEVKTPVKIAGIVDSIEGMGRTPNAGDPVFRFSVRTEQDEVKQIAAFREIGQKLNQFYTSTDESIKLQPGRPISMMAWDHTARTGSYYPSQVNYLAFPPITNQKTQQKR